MRTVLEIILSLFAALAISGGLVLAAILVGSCLFAGGCWYGVKRYRGGRRATDLARKGRER